MGIKYNPDTKKWDVTKEKTDHQTDRPISKTASITREIVEIGQVYGPDGRTYIGYIKNPKTATVDVNGGYWDVINALNAAGIPNPRPWEPENALKAAQETTRKQNTYNADLNKKSTELNEKNTKTNKAYDDVVALSSTTKGGDYKEVRDRIRGLDVDEDIKKALEDNFKTFYRTEKLQTWDPKLGAKPPYGEFDSKFYKEQNPAVAEAWKKAVAEDDIDITERYGEDGFYLQHYTTQGKAAGLRGNPVEKKAAVESYVEKKATDKEIQDIRNMQLGVDTKTQADRFLSVPEVAAEWEKAKAGDPYWKQQAKEKYLDVDKPDEFAALFRLSDRDEDKQVRFKYNANAGYGITELEDAINVAVGEKAIVDVKRFGALAQNVLQDTINEMKKARQKEQFLSIANGMGGFNEIMDINKELSNAILGDSGVGGVLAFTGGSKAQESLEEQLQKITGVQNNVVYNWQQWFDNTLKKKYDQDIELGYTTEEAKETVKVDAKFARDFIEKYLQPRFDTSRSMDEFVEYLDVRQEEQNPFQTQDILNAVSQVANLRTQQYLDQVSKINDRYFDPDFYFNPTGNSSRAADYADQAKTVAEDWEAAKNGDPYWAAQAYRFGVDINDKEAFAKMHFQAKGQGKGYDAAEDILNAGKVTDEIYNNILPSLKKEAIDQGSVFGQFVAPEEFADEMLKGLDPSNKEEWDKVLNIYGLDNFKGTIDDLKSNIIDTLRTGSAQQIRESIKYLNEKGKKPTQQELGVTYIQRPEDYKKATVEDEDRTELYKVFQSAGYKGSEDEFYNEMFPDTDRAEQAFLTKAGAGKNLKVTGLDFKDPFASLGTIESFFADDEETTDEEEEDSAMPNYFKMGFDTDTTKYKSKTGESILGEFTSMFK